MSDTYLIYMLLGCLCLLTLYLVARESSAARTTRKIMAELARSQKARIAIEHDLKVAQQSAIDQIKEQSARILGEHIHNMQAELRDMQIENDTRSLRLDRIEERVNEFLSMPSPASLDAARVVAMHNEGYSASEIARELRANAGEVSLVLKFNNLDPRR